MPIKAPLLAGGAGVGFLLIALVGPSGEPRGGVVLNRDPPQPPRSALTWDAREMPKPAGQAAGAPPCHDLGGAGEPALKDADSGIEVGLVEDPYAG